MYQYSPLGGSSILDLNNRAVTTGIQYQMDKRLIIHAHVPPDCVLVKLRRPYKDWQDLGFLMFTNNSRFLAVVTSIENQCGCIVYLRSLCCSPIMAVSSEPLKATRIELGANSMF